MKTNRKLGNPFIYFSVVAFLLIAGTLAIIPPAGFSFSLVGHALALEFLLQPQLWSGDPGAWWSAIPSPIVAIAHSLILAGGIFLNRGMRVVGIRLIVWPILAVVVCTAPLYLQSVIILPMAEYDIPDDMLWVTDFVVALPLVYFAAAAIICLMASALRQSASTNAWKF